MNFDYVLNRLLAKGWTVETDGPSGTQLKGAKRLVKFQTKGAIIVGAVLVLAYGIGLIVLVFAAIDYAMTPYPKFFLSRSNPQWPPDQKPERVSTTTKVLLAIVAVMILVPILLALFR